MMMPFMDGAATIRALTKMDPNVRIIASSGLSENGRALENKQPNVKAFLLKPYTADKLLNTLAEILSDQSVKM
jgi:CheY-like chemotaxis protein